MSARALAVLAGVRQMTSGAHQINQASRRTGVEWARDGVRSAAVGNARLNTTETTEVQGQRASAANALSVTGAVVLFPGERLGALAEPSAGIVEGGSSACVASGEVSKKGSDARAAGTVPWSASRTWISRRSSASMRRCRSDCTRARSAGLTSS
eukprot:835878-Pleurochrysis_carterae.AAC.1